MGRTVHFTREDVAAEASTDPWGRYDDFKDEIDVEEMAEAAISYEQAAGEAENAGELAELATEQDIESSEYEGMSLSDAESRLADTVSDLQGDEIAETVGALRAVMVSANDALENTYAEMYGEGSVASTPSGYSLFDAIQKFISDAQDEMGLWEAELLSRIDEYNAQEERRQTGKLVIFAPDGVSTEYTSTVPGQVDAELVTGAFALPVSLYEEIRQNYLTKAANYADAIDAHVEGHIEDYRAEATRQGSILEDAGYDLTESPLNVWHTPEMARYHAEVIADASEALEADPNDEEALERLNNATNVMSAITDDLFDENGNPVGEMSGHEMFYLHTVYSNLSADDLARVGNLEVDGIGSAQENLGNGINALMNPDVGGISRSATDRQMQMPESISEYLYSYEDHIDDASGENGKRDAMERFNGFGNLMGAATLPPSDDFAELQADAAFAVQDYVTNYNDDRVFLNGAGHWSTDALVNTGSSGLLSNVSMNSDVSLGLMRDPGTKEALLNGPWADSTGAGQVMVVAGEQDSGIAQEIVRHYADNLHLLDGDWDSSWYDGAQDRTRHPMDLSGFQQAFSDMTLQEMDSILGVDGGNPWGNFSSVFTGVALLDEEINTEFKLGAAEIQREYARQFFEGEAAVGETNAFQNIHDLATYMSDGERSAISNFEGQKFKEEEMAKKLATTTLAAAGAFATGGGATATAAVLGQANTAVGNFVNPTDGTTAALQLQDQTSGYGLEEIARHSVIAGAMEAYEEGGLSAERRAQFEQNFEEWQGPGAVPSSDDLPDPAYVLDFYGDWDGDSTPRANQDLNNWQDAFGLDEYTDSAPWLSYTPK